MDESREYLENEEVARQDELGRAHQAKRIFEDEFFQSALELVKDRIWQQFVESDLKDDDLRTRLRLKLEILKEFRTEFLTVMETGQMAEQQLSRVQEMLKKFRRGRAA